MTISTEAIVAGPFTGNGSVSVYSFAFKVFADTDVLVKHTTTAGVDSTLVLNTGYSVSRNADQDNNPGGTITYKVAGVTTNLPTNEKLTITSQVPNTQGTALPSGGSYAAKTVEKMIDKVTILVKQFGRNVTRALVQPITDATTFNELPNAAARRGKFLFFQDTAEAQPTAVVGTTSGAAVTAAWKTVLEGAGLANAGDILLGSDGAGAMAALRFPSRGAYLINGKIARTVAAGAITFAVKTLADVDPSASSPVLVMMPTATGGVFDGGYTIRKITSSLSLVISSGSTLGHASAIASPVYIYFGDNAGALVLGASNKFFGGALITSSTAEGGAGGADSATALYSTAAQTSIAWVCLQRWKSTQTTAGAWAATTGEVQLYPFPYKLPSVQVFTSTGTYTKPWDMLHARTIVLGGGAGGGGAAIGANTAAASGAAGGWAEEILDASAIGPTETATVGGAGAGAAAGNNPGADGGTSSFGSLSSATGGAAGGGAAAGNVGAPGAGGVGSGGGINANGERGQAPSRAEAYGALGASTPFGAGGAAPSATGDGGASTGYGSGGGGGIDNGTANRGGGSGAAGIVIVYEYYSEGA